MISDQLWSNWFNRDPSVIGRSYYVSDGMRQIVGVMPADFRFPSDEILRELLILTSSWRGNIRVVHKVSSDGRRYEAIGQEVVVNRWAFNHRLIATLPFVLACGWLALSPVGRSA